jgi:hypothetical protein
VSAVSGHSLIGGGAPHDERGNRIMTTFQAGVGGPGRARCKCGERSEVLPGVAARRAWHKEHKREALK